MSVPVVPTCPLQPSDHEGIQPLVPATHPQVLKAKGKESHGTLHIVPGEPTPANKFFLVYKSP